MAHEPEDTFIFDEYEKNDLESILDTVKFFADVEYGMTMKDFIVESRILSHIFAPICTFDDKN